MKYPTMVHGLTDIDLYKFNMLQVIFNKHTDLTGTYIFKCRNKDVVFTETMVEEISDQINALCKMRFTEEELNYLKSIRFLKPGFVEFLRFWHPLREHVHLTLKNNGELDLSVEGPIFSVMMFEIYLLEIVSEVYYRETYDWNVLETAAKTALDEKIKKFNQNEYTFKFAEFGCRRRFSYDIEDMVVRRFATETNAMVGTSNVNLAMKYNLTPVGTMAHEYFQLFQGIPSIPLAYTTAVALKEWYEIYQGDNGVALSDTLTTDLFLLDYDRSMCATFDGLRNDSGDEYEWGEKIITHLKKNRIDPKTKTLLFSNSLTLDKAQALYDYFKDKSKVAFGIGGHVTTDAPGVELLNIVIKLQYVGTQPVAKLSDDAGKELCQDENYLKYLKAAVNFRLTQGPTYGNHL